MSVEMEDFFLNEEENIVDKAINFVKQQCPKSLISKKWTVSDIAERFYASLCENDMNNDLELEFGILEKNRKKERFVAIFELFYAEMYLDDYVYLEKEKKEKEKKVEKEDEGEDKKEKKKVEKKVEKKDEGEEKKEKKKVEKEEKKKVGKKDEKEEKKKVGKEKKVEKKDEGEEKKEEKKVEKKEEKKVEKKEEKKVEKKEEKKVEKKVEKKEEKKEETKVEKQNENEENEDEEIPNDSEVMYAEIIRVGLSDSKPDKIYARTIRKEEDKVYMRSIPTKDGKPDFEEEKKCKFLEYFYISRATGYRNMPGTLGCFYMLYI